MRLLDRYLRAPDSGRLRLDRVALAAGIGGAATLSAAIVGNAAGVDLDTAFPLLAGYIVAGMLFFLLYDMVRAGFYRLTESHLAGIRDRIGRRLQTMRLPQLEALGRDAILFNALATIRPVSQAGMLSVGLIYFVGSIVWTLVAALIGSISVMSILLAMVLALFLIFIYQSEVITVRLDAAYGHEERVGAGIAHLLDGCQELRLHQGKSDDFFATEIDADIAACSANRGSANRQALSVYSLIQVIRYGTAGACVFGFAAVWPDVVEDAAEVALLIAFLPLGPLRDLPLQSRADRAVVRMEAFGARVDETAADQAAAPDDRAGALAFQSLELVDISFRWRTPGEEKPFHLGPVSCRFESGKIHFLTGGNGSGKSTLIALITGLQRPDGGTLLLNGRAADMECWGDLFSPVFYDFHLFERLYGLRSVDPAAVDRALTFLQIADKTGFDAVEAQFTTSKLSSGQKRRLAMVVALLEDRPIYVFDEWAADQDPDFRDFFYRVLLPDLKQRGKTVIAATHDDRYFDLADIRIEMRDGLIENLHAAPVDVSDSGQP